MKTFRANAKVRYIGQNELMHGKEYRVLHRRHDLIEVRGHLRYSDGTIHRLTMLYPIKDFELIG